MRRIVLGSAAAVAALSFAGIVYVASGLPTRAEVRALERRRPGLTALMRQREEEARRSKRTPRRVQVWVPLSRVSRHLIHAVVASEDQKFFGHEGVDWTAIEESLEKNVQKRRAVRGGSTITQQLAKNLFFGTRKTLVRKLRELVVAHWLEDDLTKARILTLYLNVIEWGDGIYGCEAAARHWYGESAADLGPAEAAGLAAMIPNPRRINPRASARRHERATRRVLWLMGLAGYLGRDAASLGAEPPPEPEEEGEEAEDETADEVDGEGTTPPDVGPYVLPLPTPSPIEPPAEPPPGGGSSEPPPPRASPPPALPTPEPGPEPEAPPSEEPQGGAPANAILMRS